MQICLKRAYDDPDENDGLRILVDRVWPRGRTKEEMRLDAWLKEIAPSTELRNWFGHDPQKWDEFKRRYFKELENLQQPVADLLERGRGQRLTLVFAARDEEHNNAVALREYLQARRK